jgi:Rad3-related DNA helicase
MDENLNERLLFHDSDNKNEILTHHFTNESASVLVSPSMSTGVSFDGDKARFQIVAKIPYPSLASQKNKMRKQQNPDYYAWKTCCGLIQMCGRIVRSHTDFGDTVIIDSSFSDVLKYSSRFLPEWFTSSVISKN